MQCHRERELVITDSICENGIGSEAYWKEARQAPEEQGGICRGGGAGELPAHWI